MADTVDALIGAIQALLRERDRVIVALDGRCASGKTTLANLLADRFGWHVVHMDDFFLRPEQRTAARYAAPGGNVDHERFLSEVLLPLRAGKPVRYRPFDCKTQRMAAEKTVSDAPVVLVEGAYACHPSLWAHYDLHVFLTVAPAEQLRRIERRNGADRLAVFRDRWIPLEEAYFRAFSVETRCELLLEP